MQPSPLITTPAAVVLYDGECAFCRQSMRFIQQRHSGTCIQLFALQLPVARALLTQHHLPTDRLDSVVLIEGDRVSLRSTAILRICRHLSGAWPLLYAGIVLPRALRDWLYDAVARRRRGQ